ncbi:MAG: bifunctional phosphoribosylaminoimidazolecarboxamide formyltransferase/IMP cyclohydrolase [Chloroflexi bacterium]|nr:bifunctional phosphoribosylaminoimidazolecarboxamide formyltransferase/IMP cyclohydrolase [Chloroflexota bacterium]
MPQPQSQREVTPLRALLSVSDKTGLTELAQGLAALGWELYATGGTEHAIRAAGVPISPVEALTGFPEILDGRVKTLHPKVHGGILARRSDPRHARELAQHGIPTIDLVAVNLYPFVETVSRPNVALDQALEQIDIGGPTLLRAAAKNFPSVLVLVDPADYGPVLEMLRQGGVPLGERRRLARLAFQHVATYDTAIAQYLAWDMGAADLGDESLELPVEGTIAFQRVQELRYGENPHQRGALYRELALGHPPEGVLAARQLHGKELSFNNILDADAAWNVVCEYPEAPVVAIIKHANPCGLASRDSLAEAYRLAFAGDPVSAYGGIVAANRPMYGPTAEAIGATFYEIVLAPGFEPEALEVLGRKRNLRLLEMGDAAPARPALDIRRVRGGLLLQTPDRGEMGDWRVVTRRHPTEAELADLRFAWRAVRHVKSNAIVVVKERALLGMGAGQPNRLISVEIALRRAGDAARGAVVASDAFFPFADGLEAALRAGVTAAVQPGGSVRDAEVIEAADRAGAAMVLTGVRHFRH